MNRLSLEYRSGDLDRKGVEEILRQELDTTRNLLVQAQDSAFEPDVRAHVEEELKLGRQGLGVYLDALEGFRAWLDTRNSDDLKRILALAAQADTYMNQAVELNFSNYRTYLESMGEFLHQGGYQGPG